MRERFVLRPIKFHVEISMDVCVPVTDKIYEDRKKAIEKATSILEGVRHVLSKFKQTKDDDIEVYVPRITLQCLIEPECREVPASVI